MGFVQMMEQLETQLNFVNHVAEQKRKDATNYNTYAGLKSAVIGLGNNCVYTFVAVERTLYYGKERQMENLKEAINNLADALDTNNSYLNLMKKHSEHVQGKVGSRLKSATIKALMETEKTGKALIQLLQNESERNAVKFVKQYENLDKAVKKILAFDIEIEDMLQTEKTAIMVG